MTVFGCYRRYNIPTGTPSAGALNKLGTGKRFSTEIAVCVGNARYEIGAWLLWITNRKS